MDTPCLTQPSCNLISHPLLPPPPDIQKGAKTSSPSTLLVRQLCCLYKTLNDDLCGCNRQTAASLSPIFHFDENLKFAFPKLESLHNEKL